VLQKSSISNEKLYLILSRKFLKDYVTLKTNSKFIFDHRNKLPCIEKKNTSILYFNNIS